MSLKSVVKRGYELYRKEGFLQTFQTGCIYASALAYHRRLGGRPFNTAGIDVFAQDWDNLILLDACRFDAFSECASGRLPGELQKRVSRGSSTSEFVRANFRGDMRDVVYVTANGWFLRLQDRLNCQLDTVYDVYHSGEPTATKMIEATREAAEQHPNKRLLIHLIPPHHPYVGPKARERLPSYKEQQERPFFERVRRGEIDISDEELWQCYVENLNRGVSAVNEILEFVEGRTVISSDHGELLGERVRPIPIQYYGHIPSLYVPELVDVPWEIIKDDRRKIVSGSSEMRINREFAQGMSSVNERLRKLGYRVDD